MLKIENADGCSHQTRIIDPATGEDVGARFAFTAITLRAEYGEPVRAVIDIALMQADTLAMPLWRAPDQSGEFRPVVRLVFEDGTEVDFTGSGTPVVTPP